MSSSIDLRSCEYLRFQVPINDEFVFCCVFMPNRVGVSQMYSVIITQTKRKTILKSGGCYLEMVESHERKSFLYDPQLFERFISLAMANGISELSAYFLNSPADFSTGYDTTVQI